ncbi:uncharacterized protein DFL_008143 [Arthrobotrys flagrans]|uniref:Uncharacterized protein n=1 Tax=Arthrobotrys flagrans TaxID=97331 RepID=A0A436ZN21_ARTFL|nr:hypothetical protein DFL_008143 [Arthrobotrys flagrans]
MSPQIQNDYMQFYFGDQAWHTDPESRGKSDRPFVGKEYENLKPFCVDDGWKEWPKTKRTGYYDPPYGREEVRYLDVKLPRTETVAQIKTLTEFPTSTVTETETTTATLILTKTVTDIPIGYTLVPMDQL